MPASVLERPTSGDHSEYFNNYIRLVPPGNLVDLIESQVSVMHALLEPLSEEAAGFAYAPGKWTLREVVGHLTDTERVFSYRGTAFSRGDAQPLPSFDQAAWAPFGEYNERTLGDILSEWTLTRRATIGLIRSMPTAALSRRGSAGGNDITVLACLCIIPGHVTYHLDQARTHYRSGTDQRP